MTRHVLAAKAAAGVVGTRRDEKWLCHSSPAAVHANSPLETSGPAGKLFLPTHSNVVVHTTLGRY